MPMKNPPHPGGLIRDNLHDLHLTVIEVANCFGVSRQQLHNVMAGKSGISAALAVKLEKAFCGTADNWLAMQAAYDLAQARTNADLARVPAYAALARAKDGPPAKSRPGSIE